MLLFRRCTALLVRVLPLIVLSWIAAPGASVFAQRPPLRPEQVFADAYKLYANELYDQAIDRFDAFRRAYPDHVNAAEALFYEAESALALGRVDQAVALFTAFQHTYPAHPLAFEARLALGQYFHDANDDARALATLTAILQDDPPADVAAKALFWMGESAQNLGRRDEALTYYRRAAEEYRFTDTAPIALYAIAFTYVEHDEYDEAARAFELLSARYPDSPYARTLGLSLAEVYYELEDYQRVVDEIQRRLPQLEGDAREQAIFLLAESYNQRRDSENAILNYRHFTEGDPKNPYFRRALYGLGWNYFQEGVYQWAADHFLQAREGYFDELAMRATYYEGVNSILSDQPQRGMSAFLAVAEQWPDSPLAPHALYELGLAQYDVRQWEEANGTFSRLISAYPNSDLVGEALRQRGYTAIALGNFDLAFRDFDRAVALDAAPEDLKNEITFQKAWLQYRLQQYDAAAPAFLELFERDPSGAKASESLFWAAESYYQLNAYDRSTRLFRRYLSDYPDARNIEAAHYALGWTYFRQGRYQEAIASFNAFLNAYREDGEFVPYRTDAQLRLADSYYALKRYPEAVRIYQRVAEDGEDYALYQIGKSYSNAGDAFEAINAFQELLRKNPDTSYREEAQYTLGTLYFQNQDYAQAISEFEQLIRTYPTDPLAARAQYSIGDALFNDGRLEEAVDAYAVVLDRYPNSSYVSDAASSIQYALIGLDDPGRADAFIEDFIARHPDSPIIGELRFRQAEVKYQSGQKDAALADFRRFLQQHPDSKLRGDAQYFIGSILTERDQPQEAERALQQVLQQSESPRRDEAAQLLGRMFLEQQRYQEALEIYRELERRNNDTPLLVAQARYGQSQALLALGRTAEAETLLREAVDAGAETPEAVPALLGLARIYETDGRTGEAVLLYRQVVDRSREEAGAEALYHLGDLLLRQGDARGAITELSRMPVLYAGFPDWLAQSYLVQARAFRSLGQSGDAARLYDRVIEEYAGTSFARQATREKASL